MSNHLRSLPIRRLLLLCAATLLLGIGSAAVALALDGGPTPPPKPLANAIHDALAAPAPSGLTARVQFVNHLLEGAELQQTQSEGPHSANPLLSGGSGRLWIAADGDLRLELQSESGATQLLYNGSKITLYEAGSGRLYEYTPAEEGEEAAEGGSNSQSEAEAVPSVASIERELTRLMGKLDISGATPTDVAGAPAYSTSIAPRRNGGLLGDVQLAWDSQHGVPLRFAIYAKGDPAPAIELSATEVSFGPVPSSVFALQLPSGVKVTKVDAQGGSQGQGQHRLQIEPRSLEAVQEALPFQLQAPESLAGMQRSQVRLIEANGHNAAWIGYGEGIGGIAVLERAVAGGSESLGSSEMPLPSVSIDGTKGSELATELGTLIRFKREGVEYLLAGSLTASTLEAAAQGL